MALWALRSGDEALSGTALEYLYNVLPRDVRESLWLRLGAPPPPASGRLTGELRADLLCSMASSELGRVAAKRTPGTRKERHPGGGGPGLPGGGFLHSLQAGAPALRVPLVRV